MAPKQLQLDEDDTGIRPGFPEEGPQTYEKRLLPPPVPGVAVYSSLSYPDDYLQTPPDETDGWMQEWLDGAFLRAVRMRASDIKLNTDKHKNYLTIDIRVDGDMRPMYRVEGMQAQRLMGHFKVNTNLSTSAAFKPEEAIREIPLGGGEFGKARVASFRKEDGGDSIVMRLPPTGQLKTLDQLSFSKDNLFLVRRLLESANQMVMLAGPMGSGKTTTAHGCLMELNTGRRSIWSIEDPVERTLPGVVQLEVNEENQAGFKELLPALMRSDYNTLFLGEIRDLDTAAAAVRQAKAGRQVLSTIHANDNIGALVRLIDLAKVSPREALDSVRGVVSQRLVAKLNPDWRDGMDPVGKYLGRVPVHEVLTLTPDIVEAMCDDSVPLAEVREMAYDADMSTFEVDCDRLVMDGVTDEAAVNEVFGGGFGYTPAKPKKTLVEVGEQVAKSLEAMAGSAVDGRIDTAVRAGLAEAGIHLPEAPARVGRRAAPVEIGVSGWQVQEPAHAPQEADQGLEPVQGPQRAAQSFQQPQEPVWAGDWQQQHGGSQYAHHTEIEESAR